MNTSHAIARLGSCRVRGEHLEAANESGDLTAADLAAIDAEFAAPHERERQELARFAASDLLVDYLRAKGAL